MKMWYSLLQATFLFGAVRSSEFVNSLGCASEVTDTDYEENLQTNDYPGSLRAVFIPPSKMQVSWEEYISYPFEELNLCLDDSCIPLLGFEGFHVFEDIQEQPSYEVFVCGNTTDLVVVNVTVITPWQLAVSTTGSTHISATWSDSEAVVEVCLSGTELTCQNISDRNMASFHDLIPNTSYILFLRSANDLYYRELVVKTAVEESYRSLSWTCQNETVCHGLECIPSLDTLVPGVGEDEIPKSYAFSCQSPYSVCEEDCAEPIQETTLQTNQSEIFIHFADFSTVSKEASCKLESSLPLFRYWCQGKQQCRIVHSITHSYFTEENNCQETDVKKFEVHTKYSNESDFHCLDGATFYEPHITCYKKVTDNNFSNARKECLSIGGDVAYVVEDEDELDFMKFLKNLTGGTSWIMGVASEPRPVKVRMDSPMYAMLEESNITQCYQENCPQNLPAACALPPVGNSPSRRLPTNIAFPKCDPNPCQNGGTCFLFASSLSPEDFEYNEEVCDCPEHFQGRFCDEKSEDSNTMNSVGLSNGTYEFSSPPNMTMVFEYAFFGQYPDENILDPRDTDKASTASADKSSMSELTKEKMKERDAINFLPPSKNLDKFSGCYAPSALALLKLRCDGRAQCQVSLRDLKEHLLSSCHPVISPKLYVRVSHHLQARIL
ncbi:uncharacterized protein LOC143036838 [Oratosquilla oratoria]|uniref:uncharacterized protein LOC143036838 n=1 Tax=Oratosquilla oratoria TaxID=337810 RepID=UPI003F775662